MRKIKRLKLDKLSFLYLLIYGYSVISPNIFGDYGLSIINLTITFVVLLLFLYLLIKKETNAAFYQGVVIFIAVGISLICFNTSVKYFTSTTNVHWSIFGVIAITSLLGLLFQLPYYTEVLSSALPELKKNGKVQIQSKLWDIHVKTTYDMGKVESKTTFLMKRISVLTYLAPGIGMLVSRNLDIRGDILLQATIFIYLSILFLLGAALPIGEFWLIKSIEKSEKIVLKI
jgi:hypothetical protein